MAVFNFPVQTFQVGNPSRVFGPNTFTGNPSQVAYSLQGTTPVPVGASLGVQVMESWDHGATYQPAAGIAVYNPSTPAGQSGVIPVEGADHWQVAVTVTGSPVDAGVTLNVT